MSVEASLTEQPGADHNLDYIARALQQSVESEEVGLALAKKKAEQFDEIRNIITQIRTDSAKATELLHEPIVLVGNLGEEIFRDLTSGITDDRQELMQLLTDQRSTYKVTPDTSERMIKFTKFQGIRAFKFSPGVLLEVDYGPKPSRDPIVYRISASKLFAPKAE